MKGVFSKVGIIIAGLVAIFGISAGNAKVSVLDLSNKAPLYLEHSKAIDSDHGVLAWHSSHVSHQSHWSHSSHQSHASHQSGW